MINRTLASLALAAYLSALHAAIYRDEGADE